MSSVIVQGNGLSHHGRSCLARLTNPKIVSLSHLEDAIWVHTISDESVHNVLSEEEERLCLTLPPVGLPFLFQGFQLCVPSR